MQALQRGSSLTTSILNLSKNIIGAGMLSLPYGVRGAGVVPFLLGITAMGVINAYTFFLLGWCCKAAGASSFGELWAKTFGQESAWIANLSVSLNNGLACIAYCVLIGDFLSKSLEELCPGLTPLHSRGVDLILAAALMLAPLSLLRDLSALRFSSMAGLFATLYGFLLLVGGALTSKPPPGAESPLARNFMPVRVDFFATLALCSSAFMAHYNSPSFYSDLQNNTLDRFAVLVFSSYGLALATFSSFGLAGFELFGFGVEGNVLKSYDGGVSIMMAWLGMAFSVVFTFPLVFSTFRESSCSLVGMSDLTKKRIRTPYTLAAVSIAALGGIIFDNVATVNGIKGAVLSACLAFVYPAVIHLRLTANSVGGMRGPLMRMLSKAIAWVGVLSGVLALLSMFVFPKTDFSAY